MRLLIVFCSIVSVGRAVRFVLASRFFKDLFFCFFDFTYGVRMKALEEKILREGKILDGNVLKVGSFLNQRLDVEFLMEMADEVARLLTAKKSIKCLRSKPRVYLLRYAWRISWAFLRCMRKKAGQTTFRATCIPPKFTVTRIKRAI